MAASFLHDTLPLVRSDAHLPGIIKILHPHYPVAESTIMHLRAVDDGGIDYDTALVACGIVASNRWDGFFATRHLDNNNGNTVLQAATRPRDGILRDREYYFQLPDQDGLDRPFPLVPSFEDWTFPHRNLPPLWDDVKLHRPKEVGISSRLTDSMWALERAHLVPLIASA